MRGKSSADLPFDVESERSLHARLRKAKQARLEKSDAKPEEEVSDHSDTGSTSDTESETETVMGEHQERLLGDYGVANTPGGRLTIVNQPVNVPNFQLHPSTINQLERKTFTER